MTPALAPVALFVYGRPDHTRRALQALRANELAHETDLFIYSDAAKRPEAEAQVNAVRAVIRAEATGFRTVCITERVENWGLARSIISGVSELVALHGKVIVLEDDLITSKHFLRYMNDALKAYADDKRIYSVSGYCYPPHLMPLPADYPHDVYLSVRNSSWGWATWLDRWQQIDWDVRDYASFRHNWFRRRAFNRGGDDLSEMLDMQMSGLIDSWAIRFSYAQFKAGCYSVVPRHSHVLNDGMDGSGVHCREDASALAGDLKAAQSVLNLPPGLQSDPRILKAFAKVSERSLPMKIKLAAKQLIKSTLSCVGVDARRLKLWVKGQA